MKKKKKNLIIFSVIFLIIVLSGVGAYLYKKSLDNNNKASKIKLYTVSSGEKVFVNGEISPEKTENIYLDATKGSVDKVSVENGQVVKKGDTLFIYKNDVITEQIEQTNRQIASNKNQRKQMVAKQEEGKKQLLAQQEQAKNQALLAGTENPMAMDKSLDINMDSEFSAIDDQLSSLQAQLNSLKGKEYTTITAPIDGRVILNEGGKNLTTPYITIESTTFYIKGTISEKEQTKLKESQPAEVLILATNKIVNGKVSFIGNRPMSSELMIKAPNGGESNISYYEVNIALDSQENLTNGFHIQATIKLTENEIKIPKTAVLEDNGNPYVFKSVDKKLVKQSITYSESGESEVVVKSGVKEGDSVVTNPTKDMKEGSPVE